MFKVSGVGRSVLGLLVVAALAGCAAPGPRGSLQGEAACPSVGRWVFAGEQGEGTTAELVRRAAQAEVILLGEQHDLAEDHRWQLHVLAALFGQQPGLVVGFEMLPRQHQQVLDRWVAGELDEAQLLEQTAWDETWGLPAELYLPLLHFVRMHAVPARALNVERELVRRIGREGWEAVPAAERYGIGPAAPVPDAYRERLQALLAHHPGGDGENDPQAQVERFVRAQSVWDRAMAEALAQAVEEGAAPVVAIVGRGHVEYGHGIAHQLADLGVHRVLSLLPHRAGQPCLDEAPVIADALFGVDEPASAPPQP